MLEHTPNLDVKQGQVLELRPYRSEADDSPPGRLTYPAAAGRGATTGGNHEWPEHLPEHLLEVCTAGGGRYLAASVVVTTGTFLSGRLVSGESVTPGGRAGEFPAIGLSDCLRRLGFRLGRLKTGTPPRGRRAHH